MTGKWLLFLSEGDRSTGGTNHGYVLYFVTSVDTQRAAAAEETG